MRDSLVWFLHNDMKKVLQLGKFYPIKGGVEKVMYDLMSGLSQRGVYCDMLCAVRDKSLKNKTLNKYANLICCYAWTQISATMISPAMILKLKRISSRYDVIHIHHPDPMACFSLFFSRYKGKVVLHWHSDILKQKFLLLFYQPFQKWLLKRADIVVGTSPVYLKESPFLKDVQHKTFCLPIGVVPMSSSKEAAEGIRQTYSGKKIIFSLGRLIEYKGFTYLIDAARFLPSDYVILIGGKGPLYESLKNQIESQNLTEKVKLLGFVSDEELPAYYAACDVFCMSSIQKTAAFGIVQIEAMSCGKPVVATKIPHSGVAWVNEDLVSGVNVEPENAEALAQGILFVTENADRYYKFCKGAKERYERFFTYEKMIDESMKLY